METDCEKCLHQKVCALWGAHESQDASCFSLDGCDYFEAALTPPNEWVSVEERLPEVYLDEEDIGIMVALDIGGGTEPENLWGGYPCPDTGAAGAGARPLRAGDHPNHVRAAA